jgi:pimeloyl-ACP methyl ester carboxylesterase
MKPVLLLHGALGTSHQLRTLANLLSTEGDVHTMTFTGHGDSSAPKEGGYSFDTFVDDILQYMERYELTQVDIFGYSMGGYAALYFASQHPEKVGKIATLGTKLKWTPEGSAQEVKMLDADKLEAKVPAFAAQLKALHGEKNWRSVLAATAQMMVNLGNEPVLNDANYVSLQHSILLTIGDKDHTAGLEDTVATFRLLPNAQLWVLPATPHPIERVDVVTLANGLKKYFEA